MRQTRFMTLFFLVLALGFFFVAEFRQALQVPFLFTEMLAYQYEVHVDADKLAALARTAEQEKDARKLAFAALNTRGQEERARLAERAVSLNPSLTWIYYYLAGWPPRPEKAREWAAQLQAWDPENAIPYLLEAELLREQRKDDWPGLAETDAWAEQTEWRAVMQKAFAARGYDNYVTRWFELQRTLLREQQMDSPVVMMEGLALYPVPDLINIYGYSNLLLEKLGKGAVEAGRLREAEQHYWTVAHFGERMHVGGRGLAERMVAALRRIEAYEALIPVLRRTGRENEAASLEHSLVGLKQLRREDPLARSSHYDWSALTVYTAALLVVVFGALTLLALVYVNGKRWLRPETKGRLYWLFTAVENYAPILFFVSCLALYLSYYPYAQNYDYYMTAGGQIRDLEPFFYNSFPLYGLLPYGRSLAPENPFQPYIWYALAGVVLVAGLRLLSRRRA